MGSSFGRTEQVLAMSAVAELRDDGSAHVTEVVDDDFGAHSGRQGIVRDVPDEVRQASIRVDSPDVPDARQLISTPDGTRIRIGDPDTTVTGRHRYRIDDSLTMIRWAPGSAGTEVVLDDHPGRGRGGVRGWHPLLRDSAERAHRAGQELVERLRRLRGFGRAERWPSRRGPRRQRRRRRGRRRLVKRRRGARTSAS